MTFSIELFPIRPEASPVVHRVLHVKAQKIRHEHADKSLENDICNLGVGSLHRRSVAFRAPDVEKSDYQSPTTTEEELWLSIVGNF
jgi:hypothetical protein